MKNIEIYTKGYCPFCAKAKALLNRLDVPFKEIEITNDPKKTEEMIRRSGRRTVPQVFIDGLHLGGSDDLAAAYESGELDRLLSDCSKSA